jgi:hypothetical protein
MTGFYAQCYEPKGLLKQLPLTVIAIVSEVLCNAIGYES